MRTFQNGTFRTDNTGLFPPRNEDRVPLINSPPAHHLRMVHPERMFCKLKFFIFCYIFLIFDYQFQSILNY